MIGPQGLTFTFYNYSVDPTTIYYMYYDQQGWPYYIEGMYEDRYYRHEYFTGAFDYTINDCSATNTTTSDYSDVLLDKVYQADQYVTTGQDNEYHYVWLSSCDGINYFYNNEVGWSWRLKAFRDASGNIDYFKWGSDMLYWDNATSDGNTYSNVTYNSAGVVSQITGPSGEVYTAYDNFTKTVNNSTQSTAVTCSS